MLTWLVYWKGTVKYSGKSLEVNKLRTSWPIYGILQKECSLLHGGVIRAKAYKFTLNIVTSLNDGFYRTFHIKRQDRAKSNAKATSLPHEFQGNWICCSHRVATNDKRKISLSFGVNEHSPTINPSTHFVQLLFGIYVVHVKKAIKTTWCHKR